MNNMKEFYEFHGISRLHFAELIGVGYEMLMKYERGDEVRDDIRLRIEIGMEIMEDYALHYHKLQAGNYDVLGRVLRDENRIMDNNFKKRFNRVILVEL